jgi:hypothetical protein
MSQSLNSAIAVIGIDIGKNSFHVVGLADRGAIVLRPLPRSTSGTSSILITIFSVIPMLPTN